MHPFLVLSRRLPDSDTRHQAVAWARKSLHYLFALLGQQICLCFSHYVVSPCELHETLHHDFRPFRIHKLHAEVKHWTVERAPALESALVVEALRLEATLHVPVEKAP